MIYYGVRVFVIERGRLLYKVLLFYLFIVVNFIEVVGVVVGEEGDDYISWFELFFEVEYGLYGRVIGVVYEQAFLVGQLMGMVGVVMVGNFDKVIDQIECYVVGDDGFIKIFYFVWIDFILIKFVGFLVFFEYGVISIYCDDFDVWIFFFEVVGGVGQGVIGICVIDIVGDFVFSLFLDFWAGRVVVGLGIVEVEVLSQVVGFRDVFR